MNNSARNRPPNPSDRIKELRDLRRKARDIYRTLEQDLSAFQQPDGTFSTFPPPKGDKIHITTTCTALMALTAGRLVDKLFTSDGNSEISALFRRVVRYKWKSEGLDPDNAFSVSFVLRAAGFLVAAGKLDREAVLRLKHNGKSLEAIARAVARKASKDPTRAFSIGNYPPKAAIVYWYIDGIDLLGIDIGRSGLEKIVDWAGAEFARQFAHVASENAALMDPVSMMMAACLAARLAKIMNSQGAAKQAANVLPSTVEINEAVQLLFKHQTPSGIWPKYFPMFHFQEAGANYCFTFEMLEALVNEMGDGKTFALNGVLHGLNDAVEWCALNRLRYTEGGKREYSGWNSGGNVKKLREGVPESWATSAVHWFLHKLDSALSGAIEDAVFLKYGVTAPPEPDVKKWKSIADADVVLGSSRRTVKSVLKQEFIAPVSTLPPERYLKIGGRRSALLFGPPGTAKTTLVRELARAVGWPCVEIRPSHFLRGGLESIYLVADEIFDDLMDLSRAVIFFDEMDALVQSRDKPLDATQQFLTTSMLPKLAELHDQEHVVFFVATNYRTNFDEAITRPGRFDLLLFVGPPTWAEKLKGLDKMVTGTSLGRDLIKDVSSEDIKAAIKKLRGLLGKWSKEDTTAQKLKLFTYGEVKSLLEQLLKQTNERASLSAAIKKLREEDFVAAVRTWADKNIILRPLIFSGMKKERNKTYATYLIDRTASRLQ